MEKNRIIINHDGSLSDAEVIGYMTKVMSLGKPSTTRGIAHYCHHTTFTSGVEVSAGITRSGNDVFYVQQGVPTDDY